MALDSQDRVHPQGLVRPKLQVHRRLGSGIDAETRAVLEEFLLQVTQGVRARVLKITDVAIVEPLLDMMRKRGFARPPQETLSRPHVLSRITCRKPEDLLPFFDSNSLPQGRGGFIDTGNRPPADVLEAYSSLVGVRFICAEDEIIFVVPGEVSSSGLSLYSVQVPDRVQTGFPGWRLSPSAIARRTSV